MAEVMKIATRDSYGKALVALADAGHDEVVVFDADLSASTKTCLFQKAYPKRFFDCGIAESNMMGVAAGMSTFGRRGRRLPPVLRGFRPDAFHPRHGRHVPGRRRRGPRLRARRV